MTIASQELSPAEALNRVNEELMPRLMSVAGHMFSATGKDRSMSPYLESDLKYYSDNTVDGFIDARMATKITHKPERRGLHQPNPWDSTTHYEVRLAKVGEKGIIGVGVQKMQSQWHSYNGIQEPGTQTLLGEIYSTLAIAHSLDPSMFRALGILPEYGPEQGD